MSVDERSELLELEPADAVREEPDELLPDIVPLELEPDDPPDDPADPDCAPAVAAVASIASAAMPANPVVTFIAVPRMSTCRRGAAEGAPAVPADQCLSPNGLRRTRPARGRAHGRAACGDGATIRA